MAESFILDEAAGDPIPEESLGGFILEESSDEPTIFVGKRMISVMVIEGAR